YLAWGFVALGLGLWNKAIFIWSLNGLALASLITIWPEIRARLCWRNIAIAIAGFAIGCFPLLLYNVRNRNATVRENAKLDFPSIPDKWIHFRLATQGEAIFGYIANEGFDETPRSPQSLTGKVSFWIHDH